MPCLRAVNLPVGLQWQRPLHHSYPQALTTGCPSSFPPTPPTKPHKPHNKPKCLPAEGGPRQQLKFPFVACEVFCCEVDALIDAVLESDRHLQHLCSLLDAEPPLNCVLAGYFARIFTALLMKRPQVTLTQELSECLKRGRLHLWR